MIIIVMAYAEGGYIALGPSILTLYVHIFNIIDKIWMCFPEIFSWLVRLQAIGICYVSYECVGKGTPMEGGTGRRRGFSRIILLWFFSVFSRSLASLPFATMHLFTNTFPHEDTQSIVFIFFLSMFSGLKCIKIHRRENGSKLFGINLQAPNISI